MKNLSFTVERTDTGFSAYSDAFSDLPVGSTGDNLTELKKNILEAVNLYFDYNHKKRVTEDQIILSIDVKQCFEYYKIINTKALGGRVGINNTLISQYVNGVKKPSEKQVRKLMTGIKEIGRELSELELV